MTRSSNDTHAANNARQKATDRLITTIQAAVLALRRENVAITISAVRRRTGCSRSFLYQNPRARQLLEEARDQPAHPDPSRRIDTLGPWRERALNAEDALKTTHAEIRRQRDHIAQLLGRIRDLETNLPADATQRLQSDNTSLRLQARDLTTEARVLSERLAAARANSRSHEATIADLQARLLESAGPRPTLRPV